MKTLADIPADVIVEIRWHSPKEIWIEAIDVEGGTYFLPKSDQQLFGINLEVIHDSVSGNQLLRVTNSDATHGFGPFVYDLAMEFSSSPPFAGMITGTGTSKEATAVWIFYRDHRPDVTKTTFDENHPLRINGLIDAQFPILWQKDQDVFPKLKESGKVKFIKGADDLLPEINDADNGEIATQLKRIYGE